MRLTVKQMADLVQRQPDVIYAYGLLGHLSDWRVNRKTLACTDTTGQRVRFKWDSSFLFYAVCILNKQGECVYGH